MNHDQRSGSRQDRVLNAETRRALRRAARLFGVAVVGVLTAIAVLSPTAATAILSAPWHLHVAVTVAAALALPVAVPYAMLRVFGLAHRDVVYVAKRAYQETVAEIIALSGTTSVSSAFRETGSEAAESVESITSTESANESTENESADFQPQTDD